MTSELTAPLLAWYKQNARELPWRGQLDPYAIWISEIMLQQTRVETVIPYYQRWMQRFPDVSSLAAASQQEVLAAWEGLGYYGRARNLHRASQVIMHEHNGCFPRDLKTLRRLPGIGRYTAGAIASISYNLDEPALDGNIRRVLARLFDVSEPARSTAGERRLWELAFANLPPGQAGAYNQALMDLGALMCTPRTPDCRRCPLVYLCQASLRGVQENRPVIQPKPAIPHYIVTAAVIERQGRFLIAQRPSKGLLGGLWEFPGGKLHPGEDLADCLKREICEELAAEIQVGSQIGVYRHAYTHFRITLHAFCCRLASGSQPQARQVQDLRWALPGELPSFPMGKVDRQIASQLAEQSTC